MHRYWYWISHKVRRQEGFSSVHFLAWWFDDGKRQKIWNPESKLFRNTFISIFFHVIWKVSILPWIFSSPILLTKFFWIVLSALTRIGITVTFHIPHLFKTLLQDPDISEVFCFLLFSLCNLLEWQSQLADMLIFLFTGRNDKIVALEKTT